VLMKATKVDGVFTADPKLDREARLMPFLTYRQALEENLGVMDAAAVALCRDNRLPIKVFNLLTPGNVRRAVEGDDIGSLVLDEVPQPAGERQ